MRKVVPFLFFPLLLIADDSMFENPAIPAFSSKFSFLLGHKIWLCDTSHSSVKISIPWRGCSFGCGLRYLNYGKIKETTHDNKDGTGRMYTADDASLALNFAIRPKNEFSLGGNINFIQETIDDVKANGASFDIGVILNPSLARWFFLEGTIKNITLKKPSFIKEERSIPKELKLGFQIKKEPINFRFDILRENDLDFMVGFKWFTQSILSFSARYKSIDIGNLDFGISLMIDKYRVEYNYFPNSVSDCYSILFGIEYKR
ncbi:TPA: hypothetical protein DCX16_06390 [bacterium]|nr:hypothetical protein [bacterium]